jgi:putative oxidoreductase
MNLTQKLDTWAYAHHPRWIDLLRIALGIILFIKGVLFIKDTTALIDMLRQSRFEWMSFALAHYVAFAHLVGGIMIAIGLLTRVAVLFQLPILLGAILFINSRPGFFAVNSELPFSMLVLLMLIFFFFYGSGPASADQALINERKEEKGG